MEIDAEMRRKIGASVLATLVFVALLIAIGVQFSQDAPSGEGVVLTAPGGTVFVGIIGLFVLIMAAVGIYLDRA